MLRLLSQYFTEEAAFVTMAGGVILSSPLFSIPKIPSPVWKLSLISRQFCCKCSSVAAQEVAAADLAKYKEAFSRRMDMAGLKPHHRVAIGVSGGPDSMALCALTAYWKSQGYNGKFDSEGFVEGVLAIIVDHGLRAESTEEASIVSNRVAKMGIQSDVVCCDWLDGKPKQGHVQEAAREMRYQIFQNVCIKNRIGVLLTAHHADDQAELFIIRLSRNSGILGLAGMPFTSQIFSAHTHSHTEITRNYGILLVRPLLDFSKEDMYKICQGSDQEWVEDPTNQSLLYARNRIRMSLRDASSVFKDELQTLISACRKTRVYIDHVCRGLLSNAVTVSHLGYVVIELEILNQSKVEDICLSKFISLVLQFISQRHRPLRGNTAKLLVAYLRTFPCKTSLTAGGCFLSPAPGSRGTKALVCCSVDSPLPSDMGLSYQYIHSEPEHSTPDEIEQIIADGKSYADDLVPNSSDVHLLEVTSKTVLTEATKLGMISESTHMNILSLQSEELEHFKSKSEVKVDYKPKHGVSSVNTSPSEPLPPGKICCFMNRFFITWNFSKVNHESDEDQGLEGECHRGCKSCVVGHDTMLQVRNMSEQDWLYLAELSKSHTLENHQEQSNSFGSRIEQTKEETDKCLHHARLSAQNALQSLKSIPAGARRCLPVLVNSQGLILSIPSINFQGCSCIVVSATFKPKVPLGGDHSSFI